MKYYSIHVTYQRFYGNFRLDTSVSPLIFADQFIKFSTRLTSPLLYGFGEHQQPLLINITDSWQRFTFYTRDFPPIQHTNLYGSYSLFNLSIDIG